MDTLDIKEIEKKLKSEFENGQRIVFWYDPDASFVDAVDTLNLGDVTIYHLTKNNSFRTKIVLEHDDPTGQYLLYAPFEKPLPNRNHLEDIRLYSKEFFADKLSLIMTEIGLSERFREKIVSLSKFFGIGDKTTKAVTNRINSFISSARAIDLRDQDTYMADVLAMCILANTNNITVDELMYTLLSSNDLDNSATIKSFSDMGLSNSFWNLCYRRYGYNDAQPTLLKLAMSLFAAYTIKDLGGSVPSAWNTFVSHEMQMKLSTISVLLDNMKNNAIYSEQYDELAEKISRELKMDVILQAAPIDTVMNVASTKEADNQIIKWIIERELAEDTNAYLNNLSIPEICDSRIRNHFGKDLSDEYKLLKAGYQLIKATALKPKNSLSELFGDYVKDIYIFDQEYRRFVKHYDRLDDTSNFEKLFDLVQNIYQNEYLEKYVSSWNEAFETNDFHKVLPMHSSFFSSNIINQKEKTVVIISDVMRYEVAQELSERLEMDPNCSVTLEAMLGPIPSYTALGMAQLLPHKNITMSDDGKYQLHVDDLPCGTTLEREKILDKRKKSVAIQYKDAVDMKTNDLRKLFAGIEVAYVYHNTIDDMGEHHNEHKVFDACDTAIDDVFSFIKRLSKSANVYRFIVTADHGFIYSRKKMNETDKLENKSEKGAFVDRRFIIDHQNLATDGVFSMSLGHSLGNNDPRWIMLPKAMSVFKAGGGMNYVHGGSSPQELIVPLIKISTKKGVVDTETVKLNLVTNIAKITNLSFNLQFHQKDAVSDVIKAGQFRIRFETEDGEVISNEQMFKAESTEPSADKRIVSIRFNIKRKQYTTDHRYFLTVTDMRTGEEQLHKQVLIDLPMTDDFGFNF